MLTGRIVVDLESMLLLISASSSFGCGGGIEGTFRSKLVLGDDTGRVEFVLLIPGNAIGEPELPPDPVPTGGTPVGLMAGGGVLGKILKRSG